MNFIEGQDFEINTEVKVLDVFTKLCYSVTFNADVRNGSGCLKLKPAYYAPTYVDSLKDLDTSDLIASISTFYPHAVDNGLNLGEYERRLTQFGRIGVGSALLNRMQEDAISYNAKVLFILSNRPNMQALLKKHNFEEDPSFDICFYKLL